MWHNMFAQEIPFLEKIIRTVVIYLVIAVLFRVAGKRGLAALNTLDFVVMFLLANVVQNAIIGNDNSVTGGVIGAVTLVVVNAGANRLALYYPWFAWLFDGTDTTVIRDGAVDHRAVRRLGLRVHDLDHAVRVQNGDDVSQVETGVLEPGGQLVLTLKEAEQGVTKADLERLATQLDRIEAALGGRPA
ncbi:MAG: DUF421 domain-containing protein [Jatrophihabitans sp.]|nr:MAG: DUF421 domain-containing protein [Jatrophihabitans sp.]